MCRGLHTALTHSRYETSTLFLASCQLTAVNDQQESISGYGGSRTGARPLREVSWIDHCVVCECLTTQCLATHSRSSRGEVAGMLAERNCGRNLPSPAKPQSTSLYRLQLTSAITYHRLIAPLRPYSRIRQVEICPDRKLEPSRPSPSCRPSAARRIANLHQMDSTTLRTPSLNSPTR